MMSGKVLFFLCFNLLKNLKSSKFKVLHTYIHTYIHALLELPLTGLFSHNKLTIKKILEIKKTYLQ